MFGALDGVARLNEGAPIVGDAQGTDTRHVRAEGRAICTANVPTPPEVRRPRTRRRLEHFAAVQRELVEDSTPWWARIAERS
jgi:hypothetical protein